jgi:photosystem II stability/assembly factor-like uncharacterized protein
MKKTGNSLRRQLFLALGVVALLFQPPSAAGQSVWTNLGLYGGQIYDIAIDPSNPDKIFAGSYLGDGLFLSTDGGKSWQAVETENLPEGEGTFKNHAVFDIEIAPSDPQIIWVAHDYWVEKSVDGGRTWTHIRNADMQNAEFRFCRAIAIHPKNPDVVYVGAGGPRGSSSSGAVFKTKDGGQTWTRVNEIFDIARNPIPEFNYPVISIEIDANCDPNQGNCNIWAATGTDSAWFGSLYRSNDEGQTWVARTNLGTMWFDMALKPHQPGDPSQVFIATAYGLVRNTYDADSNATFLGSTWVLGGAWGTENNVRSVAFDPQLPSTVYAAWRTPTAWGGDGVSKVGRSADGGDTWSFQEPDLLFLTLEVHPKKPEIVFAGHLNLGIYQSRDYGGTWTSLNDGLSAVIVNDVAVNPNDPAHILAGAISGLYEKKGEGAWSRLLTNDTWSVLWHPTDSSTFFAGIEGYLAKTGDGGLSWTFSNIPDYWSYNKISDIAIDASNPDVIFVSIDYFGNGGAIHKSEDGGASFTRVLVGFNNANEAVPMNTVAIDPTDSLRIFAGSGLYYAPGAVGDLWKSDDEGLTWTRTSLQDVIVNALLIDHRNSNIMYAGCGYSGGTDIPLYASSDGGENWSESYDGIALGAWNAVTDLEFHRLNKNILYASTNRAGVYISPDQARKWLNLGTPEYTVFAISAGSLYAATEGGLLQCTGTGIIAGELTDHLNQTKIHGAIIFNDFGVMTMSINGEYMMVTPVGIFDVTAVRDEYANQTVANVPVYGADVSWVNFLMEAGVPDPSPSDGASGGGGSGGVCFVISAFSGSHTFQEVKHLSVILVKGMSALCALGVCAVFLRRVYLQRRSLQYWRYRRRKQNGTGCIS